MKASSHEKHSKQQWKKQKKSSDPWARSGRGLAGDMGLNFLFFWFFHGFLQFGQKHREHKKKSSDPWARSGLSTHKPKNQKKTKNQKNKKTRNQKNKKTKNKKKQKNQDCTPQGEGVRCRVLGLVFLFFVFFGFFGFLVFLFFCFFVFWVFCFFGFFGFLVFPWFFAVWPKTSRTQKKKFRPMGKVWAIHTQTKKPKNQETKKPKKQKKTKKNKIAHPKGRGSDAECWVLSFCFFCFFGFLVFWFFGLCVDSHCRCAKQRLPGTVSGCTRSKVDTLQYSNVCYDIVHSANEQQRGMEFNFVRLRHMLLDLCTGNAAICALPQWPVLDIYIICINM